MLSERGGRRSWIVALACGLTLAVAGCGSSSSSSGNTVSASAYATSLCTAVAPFERDIAQRQAALDPQNIKNAAQGKTALEGFLTALAADTKAAAAKLQAAGTPDVKNGAAISKAFTALFDRLETTLSTAATSSQSLPTGDPAAFKTAAVALGNNVKSSMTDLGSGLANLKSPALETAAKNVAACKSLG